MLRIRVPLTPPKFNSMLRQVTSLDGMRILTDLPQGEFEGVLNQIKHGAYTSCNKEGYTWFCSATIKLNDGTSYNMCNLATSIISIVRA